MYDINHAESIWLELQIDGCSVVVGVIYRKPSTDIVEFQESLLSVLEQVKVDQKSCILKGDFNIDINNPNISAEMFLTSLMYVGMQQLKKSLTRVTFLSGSLIDHIYTNMGANCIYTGKIVTDISDHFLIFAVFENKSIKSKPKGELQYRSYKYYEKDKFCDSLLSESWGNVYVCTDVDKAYNIFVQIFIGMCDKHEPNVHQNCSRRKNDRQWITRAIKKSIERKHKLFGKVITSN